MASDGFEKRLETNPAEMAMEKEMEQQQLVLGQNAQATAVFLRFALQLANSNLTTMRDQLLALQDMAEKMKQDEQPLQQDDG